jgi:hypothetical protein
VGYNQFLEKPQVDKLISALLSSEYLQGSPVNLHMAYLSTSMEVITTYCFARSYNVVTAPDFQHPILSALVSTGRIFNFVQHFPFMDKFVFNMPPWLARILSPESLAYGGFIGALASQIDELLDNPAVLEKSEHEIIYHHLLTPPPGKDSGIPSKASLLDEASVMAAAGTDTVGNACTIGTFYILSDATVRGKLIQELRNSWPDSDEPMGYEKLEKLPYLVSGSYSLAYLLW